MTQEEKQLLFKDLCARLPYGVIVHIHDIDVDDYDRQLIGEDLDFIELDRRNCKPYLRPMSSMTEEELSFYNNHLITPGITILEENLSEYLDWMHSHHFDYRGLIEKGLALEAPLEMYNKEESEKGSEVPIPKTVDDAVKTLAKIISKEDRDYILENGAISVHHSMGRWIRNEWGLWTGSELKNELKKKGFEHPDDMSNYIIEEFIKYWNNKI